MHKMKNWSGIAGLCVVMCFLASPVLAGSKEEAGQFIANLGKTALSTITSSSLSDEQKRATLRTLFEKNVDIDWIAKFVLGQYWRTASPEQKTQYQAAYKNFLIKNYTTNFKSFQNSTFTVTGAQNGDTPGEYILTMTIKRPNQEDVHVDYRVREKGGGYRTYDFVVEGVSLLTSQRSEFASVVSRNGMDYLIQQIKSKAAQTGSVAQNQAVQK